MGSGAASCTHSPFLICTATHDVWARFPPSAGRSGPEAPIMRSSKGMPRHRRKV